MIRFAFSFAELDFCLREAERRGVDPAERAFHDDQVRAFCGLRRLPLARFAGPDLVPPADAPVLDAPLLVERGWGVRRHGLEPTPPGGAG